MFNPTFKRPSGSLNLRQRSPTPPRAFVEPLSPPKPQPLEPQWAYPTLERSSYGNNNDNNRNTVQYATQTPQQRPRAESASSAAHGQKRGHYRTPSTIDELAEAALAASPNHNPHLHSRSTSQSYAQGGYGQSTTNYVSYGASEPPHKRSRSDFLPTPFPGSLNTRPTTSYEALSKSEQDSRVEEAALLLNFRTNGWSNGNTQTQHGQTPNLHSHPNGTRPHSVSDPKVFVGSGNTSQLQSPLLPPFKPRPNLHSPFVQSPPGVESINFRQRPPTHHTKHEDVSPPALHALRTHNTATREQIQVETPTEATETVNSPVLSNEALPDAPVQAPVKGKRGWPKGKPRSSGARKTLADKAAAKRGNPGRKRKSTRADTEETTALTSEELRPRRKSLGDVHVFGETAPLTSMIRSKSVPRDVQMQIRASSPAKPTLKKHKVKPDTICSGCSNTRKSVRPGTTEVDDWISCNGCKNWFHLDCAGFKKAHEARDVDKYFCADCEISHGKTTYVRKSKRAHTSVDYAELQRGVLKTSEESVEHHYIQPIKDGTFQFDPENFPRLPPEYITRDFFEKSGVFTEPICIPAASNPRPWQKSKHCTKADGTDGEVDELNEQAEINDMHFEDFEYDSVPNDGQDQLNMVMPQDLTVRQVANLVGPDYPLDVIDVKTQNSGAKWNLGKWADYYEEESEDKEIRNVISLEVSQTKLGRLLKRPKVVRDIDLQDDVWPREEIDKGKFPRVQFYCLMSIADSYTDFHIDFGGSSVYYHILRGKKTFFFIPPKAKHLKAYEDWNDSPEQNYTFLPSITKECYRVDLSEGDTMLIPSGWIHAVWTPDTSLVIGGNFLTRMSYKNQFRVVDIEKNNETPQKFRYPHFQRIMWYTAIKYLKDDPLPEQVSKMFHEGQKFLREQPVWGDFDGEIASSETRPGADNARYYSQAEIDGLPDLLNFIFRTVMVVMGRVEGISADKMKRVNASIPKGFGDPLELAKAFALWVAWKRGNEDPPAWAHPDAVLPNSKDEGPPKKLSARALKEMERKAAIAAYRAACPDRQSVRVKQQSATASAGKGHGDAQTTQRSTPVASASGTTHLASTPQQSQISNLHQPRMQNHHHHQFHQDQVSDTSPHHGHHQEMNAPPQHAPAPAVMAPAQAMLMGGFSLHHLSTPKTSVLGPKRVACDACRKRRIKCKHKDLVVQAQQTHGNGLDGGAFGNGAYPPHASPNSDMGENIIVTPPSNSQRYFPSSVANDNPGQNGLHFNGENGNGPLPGTNAYVNANIPMAMNGVPMFGEVAKRGRSKACFECRKSKRRCIHDESGNIDPVKAAETPVPRGSVTAKKRSSTESAADSPLVKKQKHQTPTSNAPPGYAPAQQPTPPGQAHHSIEHHHSPPHEPQHHPTPPSHSPSMSQEPINGMPNGASHGHHHHHPVIMLPTSGPEQHYYHDHQQGHLDPNLYSAYPDPGSNGPYFGHGYPYPNTERPPLYHLPSLEQIASEVLDMDDQRDESNEETQASAPGYQLGNHSSVTNAIAKTDASEDSAVALPPHEDLSNQESSSTEDKPLTNGHAEDTAVATTGSAVEDPDRSTVPAKADQQRPGTAQSTSSHLETIPVFKPPAPVMRSPEVTRARPVSSHNTTASSPNVKRKRDSISETAAKLQSPNSAKKLRADVSQGNAKGVAGTMLQDRESVELAKALQQEDLGLRRRPSTSKGQV